MSVENFPARLHVLVARNNKTGLVIRRGPSKKVCILSWDRKTDDFEVTQWLKGRIYERRADLSPSGKYWIYFAMNGYWESTSKGSWTAIAKTPWLKAIVFLPKGDCWHGGGLFLDDETYWLNDGFGHEPQKVSSLVTRDLSYEPPNNYGGECLHIYYNRLQRDGWTLFDIVESKKDTATIFEKELSRKWKLTKVCHAQIFSPKGKGAYWDEHKISNKNNEVFEKPGWEWAEWVDNRIVFSEKGCLFEIKIKTPTHLNEPKMLHDFNDYEYEKRFAPY